MVSNEVKRKGDSCLNQYIIPTKYDQIDDPDSILNQYIIPTKYDQFNVPIIDNTPDVIPFTPREISGDLGHSFIERFTYNSMDAATKPLEAVQNILLYINDIQYKDDEKLRQLGRNEILKGFARYDWTAANKLPEADGLSDHAADILGTLTGDALTAYLLGAGSGATSIGASILEKTGGSLAGKIIAGGAENALVNLPVNVINGLADSENPKDVIKNIGTSELMDFAGGGLFRGVSSALSKPLKKLEKAAEADTAVDRLFKDATDIDPRISMDYNGSTKVDKIFNGALTEANTNKIEQSLLPKAASVNSKDIPAHELLNDVTNEIHNNSNIVRTVLNKDQIDKIKSYSKGNRQDPATYLSESYRQNHIKQFFDGGSLVLSKKQYDKYII